MSVITTISAVSALMDVVSVAMEATVQAQKIGALLQKAQAEKRDITDEEWKALDDDYQKALDRLKKAI